ncbi:cysteine hydrolase family protein [Paraburkholderia silviterrae]|uniref:Cysteine hydrolase n=2 Tax=Paraburkholderia TaxID=1822464 RepID=A0A9X1RVG3_9BURK|nr:MULTISPECIES: isochorismatase family cysteine hydrolase [Paraburkholderia]MCG5076637.1 cysteine hydrolase [Paraburkholderia tagetis]TDG20519.1 cysteine hydrolase [Paraburkholderia silviterrae]
MKRSDKAFLLIDMQQEDGFVLDGFDETLRNAGAFLEFIRGEGIPVIYTKHINRADGVGLANGEPLDSDGIPQTYCSSTAKVEICDLISPKQGDVVIEKYRYSGFFESNLDLILRSMGVKSLIVGGVLTDVCVMTTVFDAYFRDYQVTLIEDVCGATTSAAHHSSLMIMANWVYDLQIFKSTEYMRYLRNEEYKAFKHEFPDEFAHAPEQIVDAISKLKSKINH